MAWPTNPRPARSLLVLHDQVDARWPARDKSNDGMLASTQHHAANPTSDHEANAAGVVTAIDITKDLTRGLNSRAVAQALLDSRDPRIKYIISDGQICSSKVSPWVWRPYTGADDHSHHFHLSVDADPALYDDTRPWKFDGAAQSPKPGRFTNITATEFGGAGDEQPTAYTDVAAGWPQRPGVALPFRFGQPRPRVRVFRDRKSIDCEIVDVGPWNINDPYWRAGARPQAEAGIDLTGRKTNGAGIDLTPAAALAIGLNGKGSVDWEFIGAVPVAAPASPIPTPPRPVPSPPRPIPTGALTGTPTHTEPTMNPFAFLKFMPLVLRLIQFVPQIQAALKAGSIFALLPQLAPQIMSIFQELGAELFPTLPVDQQTQAGAVIADPAKVLFIQGALNKLGLANPPLVVDGYYGSMTKAAVTAFQTAHGMTVDGWAGDVTAAALQAELDKLPKA